MLTFSFSGLRSEVNASVGYVLKSLLQVYDAVGYVLNSFVYVSASVVYILKSLRYLPSYTLCGCSEIRE